MTATPFTIEIPDAALTDLRERLRRTRWLWDQLLTDLGHDRYGAHGGDWGVLVTGLLGWKYPERVVGIHRLAGGIPRPKAKPGETDAERQVRLG